MNDIADPAARSRVVPCLVILVYLCALAALQGRSAGTVAGAPHGDYVHPHTYSYVERHHGDYLEAHPYQYAERHHVRSHRHR